MVLTVDIGNTNMEFGVFVGDKLDKSFRLSTNKALTSDELGLFVTQFFDIWGMRRSDVEDVVICSVVPQLNYTTQNAVQKYFDTKPLWLGDDISTRIPNGYGNPAEVGVDRLVTAFAASHKYGPPVIVVDFGTATTLDLVDAGGVYRGGAIFPGVKVALDAQVSRAAKLHNVEIEVPESPVGTSTVTSIQSGIIYGYAGAVQNIVEKLSEKLTTEPKVIGTGGLAKTVAKAYKNFHDIDRKLIMEGMKTLYDMHVGG